MRGSRRSGLGRDTSAHFSISLQNSGHRSFTSRKQPFVTESERPDLACRLGSLSGRNRLVTEECSPIMAECGWCYQRKDMTKGIYDDGEWMCGECISRYAR